MLIWGPFWVTAWGLGVEGCRQQLKDAKIAPLCSGRPVLTKRLPPSVLAFRRDLRGFQCQTSLNKHANHDGQRAQTGETFWPKRAWRCRGVRFLTFIFAPGHRTARAGYLRFAEGALAGGTSRRGSCITCYMYLSRSSPRTLRDTLQAGCAADCQRFASTAAHFTFSI